MNALNCGTQNAGRGLKGTGLLVALALLSALPVASGCRQKMADQPYYRPLDEAEFFPDKRASRPLEHGTIHRGQYLDRDPIATGLALEEWARSDKYSVPPKVDQPKDGKDAGEPKELTLTPAEKVERAIGAPRYDQRVGGQPKVYAEAFPFPITQQDLKRGQDRFTIYCAVCHGPLGNGQGKIWERGYLTPTSFHRSKVTPNEVDVSNPQGLGVSRGYSLWGVSPNSPMYMDEVPVGYIFEVMTKGYAGMPSYSAQIPPDDRWRIIAYIKVLQMSQRTDAAKLPPEVQKLLAEAGGKK
jgi:mono/diheme cytochrome c family protein